MKSAWLVLNHSKKMNQTICEIKGTADGNWGDICVLAVGDLYQSPPIAQCPIYLQPPNIHTLNDFAPNGWEKMCLHELTQPMHQKDPAFAHCLNRIRTCVPEQGSEDDLMLQSCELNITPEDDNYPWTATHVYAWNQYCDEWNEKMLQVIDGEETIHLARRMIAHTLQMYNCLPTPGKLVVSGTV